MQDSNVNDRSWKYVVDTITKELERQEEEIRFLTRTKIPQMESEIVALKIKIYLVSVIGGFLSSAGMAVLSAWLRHVFSKP